MFQIATTVSSTLKPGAIERAVKQFLEDTSNPRIPLDKNGLYTQMIGFIGGCLISKNIPNAHVWIKEDEDGEVGAFALTQFDITVDNKLTLRLSVAWVRPCHRFTPKPKQWFHQLEDFGKASGAKHLLIPSVRESRSYLRFVGKDWHIYETILKKDL